MMKKSTVSTRSLVTSLQARLTEGQEVAKAVIAAWEDMDAVNISDPKEYRLLWAITALRTWADPEDEDN